MLERARAVAATLAVVACAFGCAGGTGLDGLTDALERSVGSSDSVALDDSTIIEGLKDALKVGTERAVVRTSAVDGFLGNEKIRIPLPESLDTMASGMRTIGLGSQVDEVEVAMNRAAELAAAEAAPVFWEAIQQMSFSDARNILDGGDNAATEYFQQATRAPLKARFEPIVGEKMNEVGLVRTYDGLAAQYNAIPFKTAPAVDLRDYVADRGLDGLFTILGEEEKRIRKDPSARATDLLRAVFGDS